MKLSDTSDNIVIDVVCLYDIEKISNLYSVLISQLTAAKSAKAIAEHRGCRPL